MYEGGDELQAEREGPVGDDVTAVFKMNVMELGFVRHSSVSTVNNDH